jgi:hypothetical protein
MLPPQTHLRTMESLKKARALKSQQSLAAEAAQAEAARAEAARAEELAALRLREEQSLSSEQREEEKALENVLALFLDIKKKRAAAAAQAADASAASPGTPEKPDEGAIVPEHERPSSGEDARDPPAMETETVTNNDVFLSEELNPSEARQTTDDDARASVSEPVPEKEKQLLPKGNLAPLVLDAEDLASAFGANEPLRRRLCRNLSLSFDVEAGDTLVSLAKRAIAAADRREVCLGYLPSRVLTWHDLELAIRGWAPVDYQPSPDAKKNARANQLRGAAARAEQARLESGGFAGLDAAAAAAVAARARDLGVNRRGLYTEREPEVFSDGAVYFTDAEAKKMRDVRLKEIEQTLRDEGLLRDEFPGLTATQAREIIAAIKLGGEVVDVEDDEDMKRRKTRKLPEKLELLRATPVKCRSEEFARTHGIGWPRSSPRSRRVAQPPPFSPAPPRAPPLFAPPRLSAAALSSDS